MACLPAWPAHFNREGIYVLAHRTRRSWWVELDGEGVGVWLAFSRSGLSCVVHDSEATALRVAEELDALGKGHYPSHEAALELAVQHAQARAAARRLGGAA